MSRFTIDITDPASVAGITAAREQHNTSLPELRDDDGNVQPEEDHPDYLATDADYVQHVMGKAAESYAKSFGLHEETLSAEEAAVAAKRARLERR